MITTVLIENALIVAACFAVLWLIALRLRDVSLIDAVVTPERHEKPDPRGRHGGQVVP